MTATTELLDMYRQARNLKSDNAAALSLGVKRQTINNWRMRGSQGEPHLIERMCEAIGLDLGPWLLRALAEQSPAAANKQVWKRLTQRLGYAATAAVTMALAWTVDVVDTLAEVMPL